MTEKKKGIIRSFFSWLFSFIKRRPLISIAIFAVIVVVGLVGTYEGLHLSSEPEFCALCHPEEGTGVLAEYHSWEKTVHAANDVKCLDCHTIQPGIMGYAHSKAVVGLHDLVYQFLLSKEKKIENLSRFQNDKEHAAELVGANVCLHCHSDSVNQENRENHYMSAFGVTMRGLDTIVNPEFRESKNAIDILTEPVRVGVEPNHAKHVEMEVACITCHEGLGHSGQFRGSMTSMDTCFTCHDEQREKGLNPVDSEDCSTCHVQQPQMQEGTLGNELGIIGIRWEMADLTCDSCHMDAFDRPTPESCMNCHDEGYDELMIGYQEEFEQNMAGAQKFYAEALEDYHKMTPGQRELFRNYDLIYRSIKEDGSRGVHNPEYYGKLYFYLDGQEKAIRQRK